MCKRNKNQQYGTEDQFGTYDAFGGLGSSSGSSDSDLLGGSLDSTSGGFGDGFSEVETVTWRGQKYTPGVAGVEEVRIDHHKDIRALIYSVLGGILGVLLSILIFSLFPEDTLAEGNGFANIVLIAMLSGLTALFSYLGIVLYSQTKAKGDVVKKGWLPIVALGLVGMLAAGGLLQFLYALEIVAPTEEVLVAGADDYVFVLDDSGSMDWNDPNNQRVPAMEGLLTRLNPKNRVALVVFDHSIKHKEELAPIGSDAKAVINQWSLNVSPTGGTNIDLALDTAFNLNGVLDPSRKTEMVILTDAEDAGCLDYYVYKDYCDQNNITMSMILLGVTRDMAGELGDFCEATGGQVLTADNADQLAAAYDAIYSGVINQAVRDLIGSRPQETSWNLLLAILRILGWTLIGALYTMFLKALLDKNAKFRYQEGISVTAGFVVGLAAEILGIVLPGLTVGRVAFAAVAIPLMCIVNSSYDTFFIKFQEAKEDSGRTIRRLGASNDGLGGGSSNGTDSFGF